ncbi:MAG: flagellar motor switch protein FliG [Treponema sp.]|nr:flagellar motor switch protein FliG [Treponema sp.]
MNQNDYRLRAYASQAKNDGKKHSDDLDATTAALKKGGLLKVPLAQKDDGQSAQKGDSVYRRVAKFLLLIGSDQAAEVFKFLPQEDVEKIIPEITTIRSVEQDEAAAIFEEFRSLVEIKKENGGEATAFNILEKAFGAGKAGNLMKKVEAQIDAAHPFKYLKDKTEQEILSLVKGESGQIIALVLSYLEPKVAAGVINLMDPAQKKEVVLRLAKMQKVAPEVIQAIDKTIQEKASKIVKDDSLHIDGRGALAQILKRMDSGAEQEILDNLERTDPNLSRELQQQLFTLDDVVHADDKWLQKKLSTMSDKDIAYLIAAKEKDFEQKILSNVSVARASVIMEEQEAAKPMLKKDVEAITKNFVAQLRAAWEKGDLRVFRKDDDEVWVQ